VDETLQMLNVYTDFAVNEAAIPVIPRQIRRREVCWRGHNVFTEAMMGDQKPCSSVLPIFWGRILRRLLR